MNIIDTVRTVVNSVTKLTGIGAKIETPVAVENTAELVPLEYYNRHGQMCKYRNPTLKIDLYV